MHALVCVVHPILDARSPKAAFDLGFHDVIVLHEHDVADVEEEQDQRLPPVDDVIREEDDEQSEGRTVEADVTEERPPGELQHVVAEQGAHADDKKDVEDGRTDDGANAHVTIGDENADDAGEELGGAAAGGHEGGARHVRRYGQLLRDDAEWRHEELVTHDSQRHEHVRHAHDVQQHRAAPPILQGEDVPRVVGVRVVVQQSAADMVRQQHGLQTLGVRCFVWCTKAGQVTEQENAAQQQQTPGASSAWHQALQWQSPQTDAVSCCFSPHMLITL